MDFDESSVAASPNGDLWVIGDFRSSFNIPKFLGTFTALSSTATERDAFVLKYKDSFSYGTNPTGEFLKKGNITNLPGNKMLGIDIAVEKETGNAFLTGTKKGICNIAFGIPTYNLPPGASVENGYFIGMRFNGNELLGGAMEELSNPLPARNSSGTGVAVQDGIVYFTGTRRGDIHFVLTDIPGSRLDFFSLAGDQTLYVVAYNSSTGAYLWSNGTRNPAPLLIANHQPMAITADGAGHLFITGYFQSEMGYIGGIPASGNLTSVSNANLFAMRVDIEGTGAQQLQKPSFVDLPLVGSTEAPIANENTVKESSFDVLLVPNPAAAITTLVLTNFQDKTPYGVRIYSTDGRLMYEATILAEKTEIDVSTFADGLYTAIVYSNGEAVFKKLLKTN
jgi:hypothetical protein